MLHEDMGNASATSTVHQEQYIVLSPEGMLEEETDKCTASAKPRNTSLLSDCGNMRQYDSFKQKYDGLITYLNRMEEGSSSTIKEEQNNPTGFPQKEN